MPEPSVRSIVLALALSAAAAGMAAVMKGKPSQDKPKESTADLWKKVEAAEKDGLPQTAVGYLKTIVARAEADQHFGEALRALTRRLILEGTVEGNKPETLVALVREEIDRAPAAMKPVLRVVLARWYWQYYSRNKWRFLNRSATAGVEDDDFTAWDLKRLFGVIDGLYRDILKDEAALKKTPLALYSDFLEPGDMNAALRPTLFDFVAYEALEFYTSGEQAAALPEDAFVIDAASPALASAAEFLRYAPQTTDVTSPKLRALTLFQDLLRFHRFDSNPDAALDADLQRLRYVRNEAAGEGASARYLQRLQELAESHSASALSVLVLFDWAQEVYDRGDFTAAFALAGRGLKVRPQSLGTANCAALQDRITAKEFDLRAESVVPPQKPSTLVVRCRNVAALYFRIVREDFDALIKGKDAESLLWMRDETVKNLLAREPAAHWSAALPPAGDYKDREALIEMPALEPGFYRILAGCDKNFAAKKNKIQTASIWVSELGIVSGGLGGGVDGTIVQSATGDPIAQARISLFQWDYNAAVLKPAGTAVSDETGAFALPISERYGNRILVIRDPQGRLLAETRVESSLSRRIDPYQQTVFFTDRSIYRPGQTIYFKGLCLSVDRQGNDYRRLVRQAVRVAFKDANRQDIAALDLVSNDFGSLSGSFTAPADRLTGAMTIAAESPRGTCTVRVEEYKRPKFEAALDVPDKEFRLNDEAAVPGRALSYTGAPVDGAQVRYRVERNVHYPRWWSYWQGNPGGGSQEIAHGTVRTDETGRFVIPFQAKPDPSVPMSSQPVFAYSITADVTDSAGETRSASGSIRVGYASLDAGIDGAEWQEPGRPVVLSVTTKTLNARNAAARGIVEISALQGPDRPVPADLIGEVDVRAGRAGLKSGAGFRQSPDWRKWPDGATAATAAFETQGRPDEALKLSFDLKAGAYRARLKTQDRYGTPVESLFYFLVFDPGGDRFPLPVPFHAACRSTSVEVGRTFEMLWGTGYDRGPVLIEVLQNGRRLRRYWTPAGPTQGLVRIPVEASLRGGFTAAVSMVKENRFYREEQRVDVPWTEKSLSLKWKTFRSKLRPGQAETWALQILGPRAEIRAAEFVASLYDASLDQFAGHGFPGLSGIFRRDDTYFHPAFGNRRQDFRGFVDDLNSYRSILSPSYAHFPESITEEIFGYRTPGGVMKTMARPHMAGQEAMPSPPPSAESRDQALIGGVVGGVLGGVRGETEGPNKTAPPAVDLTKVQARTNFNETAFFYPHLLTDREGVVTLEFKMPEALTRWRFLGFAHTKDLESGSIEAETVTQKEIMVQPNAPRFLREGDAIEFTVKVTNMSEKEAAGAVELRFFDPADDKSLDAALANAAPKLTFAIPAKQSRSFSWPIAVPDGLGLIGYKAVAATPEFSDGEEAMVPVLSRRLLVRESIPLWINDKGEKTFTFAKLVQSGGSTTLRNLSLTVQMASNPAWYAVQALPYLMEFPYECSEQVFNRLYANGLAQKIAGSSPKIRRIFDLWKGTEALESNLEKNQDLKSILLQESPWVLEARSETQAKRNAGLLFDENTMSASIKAAYDKLAAMQ
ncbi:MAG: alpha-2-macroglobulin family protein, partial [Candidatus Aminicenantales bacterium]